MEEKSRNMTDEHLSRQLRKSKSGKLGGKLLSLVGGVVAIAGIILGGNIVLVVIGGVILGLGQMGQGKAQDKGAGKSQGQSKPAGLRCHRTGHRKRCP